jgi:hypothetical protein
MSNLVPDRDFCEYLDPIPNPVHLKYVTIFQSILTHFMATDPNPEPTQVHNVWIWTNPTKKYVDPVRICETKMIHCFHGVQLRGRVLSTV